MFPFASRAILRRARAGALRYGRRTSASSTVSFVSSNTTNYSGSAPTAATMFLGVAFAAASVVAFDNLNNEQTQPMCLCESSPAPSDSEKDKSSLSSFRLKEVYDIERVLGEGAYGLVYQARRKKDGLVVALKAMPRECTGQTDFEREVAALQLLSHPPGGPHDHVVKLYDLHRDEKNYYLAMELVKGGELLEHLIENGPYSEALAASFMRQFAEALCHVHQAGYTHSDLKPENLMLATSASAKALSSSSSSGSEDNTTMALKVVDFGSARKHDLGRKDLLLPADEFALGCRFLHQVALGNQFELQRLLQGQPNLVNFRDYDKRTALHVAASEGHLDICRFLVQHGARINRVDRWGGSPLDDAHRQGHADVLQFLGQNGAKFGNATMAIDKFINAASEGAVDEVQALLNFGNIEIDQGDYDKRTALHLAAGEGRLTIVKMLCEAGANVNVEDRWGNCPLDDAKNSKKNSAAIIKILKTYGAKESSAKRRKEMDSTSDLHEQIERTLSNPDIPGTLAYWSPELFAKDATSTPAADMWASGVIVYILLTGSHPFDKDGEADDEEIAKNLIKVGLTSKIKDGDEQQLNLMDELVFDERVEGLSESCINLMKQLMHPDPDKRMSSDDFRRHPWIQGLTASWESMAKGFEQLESGLWQNRFRAEILKKFAPRLGIGNKHNGESSLSEKDLQALFQALDIKQNGVLELDEIAAAFQDLDIPDKHIRNMFGSADLDGTGVIHWDEFRALMTKHMGEEDGADGESSGLQVMYLQNRFKDDILNRFDRAGKATSDTNKLREIFNAIDLEGNGVLDPHEIRVVLRSAGEPEDVISRIVASLDARGDGGVEWSEFQRIMGMEDTSNKQ